MRRLGSGLLSVAVVIALSAGAGAAAVRATAPAPPPPTVPTLPAGKRTSCRMTGPAWTLYGVHAPNGPPRRGNRYLVHAWGITCAQATSILRAFFPRIPAHPMGVIARPPKGYRCKGRDAPGTVTRSTPHDGSCIGLSPPTMFDWGPVGGS